VGAQNRPNLMLRSLWAGTVVSFLAGPIFLWLLIAIGEPEPDSEFPVRAGDIGVLLYLFPSVSVVGLVGAVPASIANALVVAGLAKKRVDGIVPATISGAIWSVVIPVIAFRLFGSEQRNLIGGEHTLTAVTCLALTGVLLGIMHWMIAVRPYRVWRL
jgi:hypothetical protein